MVVDIIERCYPSMSDTREKPSIGMSPRILEATDALRDFLFERVYNVHSAQGESEKARGIVRALYKYFKEHADKMPQEYKFYSDELERRVVDYIAGMTDQYAARMVEELYPAHEEDPPPPPVEEKKKGKNPPKAIPLPLFGDEAPPH
jgi:dGTP triphosphohydrolase